jgi:polyphenol oxidase
MIENNIRNRKYLSFKNLTNCKGLTNFVSTRDWGDMAYRDDKPLGYIENRKNFLNALDIELNDTVFCEQVHKDRIVVVDNKLIESRAGDLNIVLQADGLITETPEICLVIRTSDCVPLIMYDPIKHVLGVAHAGWRGTIVEIARRTVEALSNNFQTDPKDLICAIGPSIGPKDYLVRKDVEALFREKGYGAFIKYHSPDQWLLDLWGVNKKQLITFGVKERNIEISNISTFTSDLLFSNRKKDPEGHFITGAMLK